MDKKGVSRQYLWVFYLILNVIILVSLLTVVNGLFDGSGYFKDYGSRDTALVVDVLYASPGDVTINYDKKGNHTFKFDKGLVKIKGDALGINRYSYVEDRFVDLTDNSKEGSDKLIFTKNKEGIKIE